MADTVPFGFSSNRARKLKTTGFGRGKHTGFKAGGKKAGARASYAKASGSSR